MDEKDYSYYNSLIRQKFRNFKFYMNGLRNPQMSFLKYLQMLSKELNLNPNFEKSFSRLKIRFGHGGNAASAELPAYLSPELVYLVGAMRDGTLARSGKSKSIYTWFL